MPVIRNSINIWKRAFEYNVTPTRQLLRSVEYNTVGNPTSISHNIKILIWRSVAQKLHNKLIQMIFSTKKCKLHKIFFWSSTSSEVNWVLWTTISKKSQMQENSYLDAFKLIVSSVDNGFVRIVIFPKNSEAHSYIGRVDNRQWKDCHNFSQTAVVYDFYFGKFSRYKESKMGNISSNVEWFRLRKGHNRAIIAWLIRQQ